MKAPTELKGLIARQEDDTVSITCCRSVPRIKVGETDVYDLLDAQMASLQSRECGDGCKNEGDDGYQEDDSKEWRIRYIVQPIPFESGANFEDHAARVQAARLYSEVDRGCYSEWTCGVGGFDFMLEGSGHSLLNELNSYVGQYVWLKFT